MVTLSLGTDGKLDPRHARGGQIVKWDDAKQEITIHVGNPLGVEA